MSDLNKLARPYAKAIFEFACETNNLDQWEQNLASLALVAKDSDIQKVLLNPSLSKESKQDLILEVAKLKEDKAVVNLIKELSHQKRLSILLAIYTLYISYKNEKDSKVNVELISAFELSESQIETLRKGLEKRYAKKMDFEFKIDTSLIGGLIIRLGDMVMDYSLKGRLSKLSEVLQKQ